MDHGQLAVEGDVFRQHAAETTTESHIDLVFTDATGRELAVDTTSLYPRSFAENAALSAAACVFPGGGAAAIGGNDGH